MGVEERVGDLEKRVKHLEERVNMLIEIADYESKPFTFLALEAGLSDEQIDKIFDLMDEVSKSLRTDKPMSHGEFEDRVYQVVPTRKGNYHFVESIVRTLNKEGRWQEVYTHMKKDGMNI